MKFLFGGLKSFANWMKSLFTVEGLRKVSFLVLFGVSVFLSINLYIGLVSSWYNKVVIGIVASIVEAIKILALTSANVAVYKVLYYKDKYALEIEQGMFSRRQRRKLNDIIMLKAIYDKKKQIRNAIASYTIYAIAAMLSVIGSFGWTLENIAATAQEKTVIVVDNTDKIKNVKDRITGFEDIIINNEIMRDKYVNWMSEILPDDPRRDVKTETYRKKVEEYQGKIDKAMKDKEPLIQEVATLEAEQKKTAVITKKDIYELMADFIKVMNAEAIRFILLLTTSIIIEVGIFMFAPHPKVEVVMEDELIEEIEEVKPKRQYRRRKLPIADVPEPIEQEETTEPEEPVAPVEPSEVIREVETPSPGMEDRFINALFNNGENTFLKDKALASDEALISRADGLKIFNAMIQMKGPTSYPLIEFRDKKWYPNYTSEVTKAWIKEHPIGE